MNTENLKNVSASVHQRLLNKARQSSRPFNELLQHYAIERFLYRLSMTPYAEQFFLKGALMFSVWSGPWTRPTMDIDLLGEIDNSLEMIIAAIKEACEVEVEADGMSFDQETVTVLKESLRTPYMKACAFVFRVSRAKKNDGKMI